MRTSVFALALACASTSMICAAKPAAEPDIPHETFRLDNGLTVIVHEDRKAPIVAVNLWYHVGSKDEQRGKTGFAHLFEHLMFQGSENHRDEFFKPFEDVGVTDQNGTTNQDRTNYFENVPTTALDRALWLESDRMGHLLGAIDQATLDEQRGVVQNEKREGENAPYGKMWDQLLEGSYPAGHPYSWTTIGSMEDLNAASLDDVKTWFKTYYGPNNAVLVLAGDIDVATAKEKARRYFGDIPPGPPLTKHGAWPAPRESSKRDLMYDRVAQPRIVIAYNVPESASPETNLLAIGAQVLGGGKTSRLYQRLVVKDQLADAAGASVQTQELGSMYLLYVDVKTGVEPARAEAVLREELAKFIAEGPNAEELAQVKTQIRAGFIRGIERIGGLGGKADVLAECQVFEGRADCFRESLRQVREATAETVRATTARWLARGDYTLSVLPFVEGKAVASDVDRTQGVPPVTAFPDLSFPDLQRATLSNGLKLVLAERHEVPVVQLRLQFNNGQASDEQAKLGLASFTMGMLDEGAGKFDSLGFAKRVAELGAGFGAGAGTDTSNISLSALSENLAPSLDLFADAVLRPRFPDADLERVRKIWLSDIAQEKTDPGSIALRLLPPLLYGHDHAYGMPFTGSGTEATIAAITREDLTRFHRTWIRPDNATLIVVGDTTLAAITPLLEARFGSWRAPASALPALHIADVALPAKPRLYLIDKPGSPQSLVLAGHVVPGVPAPDFRELGTANAVLGGMFSARLNMNLREGKHWAYGAYSSLVDALHQRPFLLYAPVQTDKTAESVAELRAELTRFVGEQPATAQEIARVKQSDVRELPGRFETAAAVAGAISSMLTYSRPDDYIRTLKARIEAQSDDAVRAAASAHLHPEALTWVVVGDLAKIEAPLRALNIGEVAVIDADGKPVR